jgi:hypothetical protein
VKHDMFRADVLPLRQNKHVPIRTERMEANKTIIKADAMMR